MRLLPALPLLALLTLQVFARMPQAPARPPAGEAGLVFRNATIWTGKPDETGPLVGATLETRGGKIVAVHPPGTKVELGVNMTAIDLAGKVVIPGLVDTHSHIGLYPKPSIPAHQDGNEMSGPVQPGVRAVDAVWPADPGIQMALAGGVTTANIMPGSGNVIGGQTVYVKLVGDTVHAMRVTGKLPDGTEVLGGLKMANGENPKGYGRLKQQAPFTRMKVAALQREQFQKAREYQAKRKSDPKADRDVNLDPLVEVLERRRTVHFHCHRADDLVTAMRIAEEFNFEIVLQHATEGYRVAPLIAAKKVACSLTLLDSPGGKAETMGLLEENAAALVKAGVAVCVNTDDFITESRFYLRTAALAARGGLTTAQALRTVTSTPAKVLHLDHRVGTLEAGKDADFVVLSGEPLSYTTKVLATYIDGKKVFDAGSADDRRYRDGGFALPLGVKPPAVPAPERPKPVAVPKDMPTTREALKPGLIYVRAGRVHTSAGDPIPDGGIVIRDGVIEAVGPAAEVKRPLGARVLSAAEVTPGLIDAGTSAGLSGAFNIPADQDQDEPSDPNQAELRVLDGFNHAEPMLEFLRGNGVTTAHVTPGRVNVLAGTSGVFRLTGPTADAAALAPAWGVWVNLGETPKDAFKAKGPTTRMGTAALVRKAFAEADSYRTKKGVPRNPKHDALVPALEGKRPVVFAAHRADDIRTALRISDEFKLKPVIALGTEAYLMADELAARKVPVIVHPAMQRPGGSMETLNTLLGTAAALKAKGVTVVLGTNFEGYVPKQRMIRAEAAVAAANGLGHAGALAAITSDAAKLLGIDAKVGALAKGKVADVVLYDGDPFEHTTHVTQTIMAGKVVYDRREYEALPLDRRAMGRVGGGDGVGCCLGW